MEIQCARALPVYASLGMGRCELHWQTSPCRAWHALLFTESKKYGCGDALGLYILDVLFFFCLWHFWPLIEMWLKIIRFLEGQLDYIAYIFWNSNSVWDVKKVIIKLLIETAPIYYAKTSGGLSNNISVNQFFFCFVWESGKNEANDVI